MCSPAGMSNTNGTTHILVTTILTEIINLSLRLVYIQTAVVVNQSDTS